MSRKEKQIVSDDGSYVVKKSKKLDVLAFILCLIVAFCVWVYVMNTQNTDYTKTFTLDLETINENVLEDGTGYSVFDVADKKVQLTIKGKKSEIRMLSEKDFLAYCDVSTISESGRNRINISVELPTSSVSVAEVKPDSTLVYVDYAQSKAVHCEARCEGNDALQLEIVGLNSQISVSGPKIFVEQIEKVVVRVPDSDYEVGQKISSGDYIFLDKEGKELRDMLYVTTAKASVELNVVANGK